MASIVQRNKSFSVVYTIYEGDKKKQKWETYHSYEAALRRKEQLDLIQLHEKERAQYREGTLVQFLEEYEPDYIRELLAKLGGNDVVLTGVSFERGKTGAAIRSMQKTHFYFHERYDRSFHGTGDIFASAFTGALMQDRSITDSVRISADFTCRAIRNTIQNPAHWYGVKFETALGILIDDLK